MITQSMEPMMYLGSAPTFDELPPAGFVDLESFSPDASSNTIPAAKVTRIPVRIVRAKTGSKELRLLSEREDGEHRRFILQRIRITPPYETEALPLNTQRRKRAKDGDQCVPMSEEMANRAFDTAVAKSFPDIELRPGVMIPTATVVL